MMIFKKYFYDSYYSLLWLFKVFIFFTLSPILVAQQVVTGRITETTDGAPIYGASVFIANTTIGTISDESGDYSITVQGTGSFEIVVSHAGFQSVFHKINTPQSFHRYDVVLEITEIPEIIIRAEKNYRQSDVDLFWLRLLGEKPSKGRMEVLNSEKVHYYLNNDNVLKVTCRDPIEIINHQMGYRIKYTLQSFEHDYRSNETTFLGMPFFEELFSQNSRQKKSWEKKRQEKYAVSTTRFLRALYREQIQNEGFLLLDKKNLEPVDNSGLALVHSGLASAHVDIKTPLLLICYSKPVTARMIKNSKKDILNYGSYPVVVEVLPQQIEIYPDGTYTGILKTHERGISLSGLSSIIPVEYADKVSKLNQSGGVLDISSGQLKKQDILPILFHNQLAYFPQEKLYLFTDKPYYISGERIWFRAYLADATSHIPNNPNSGSPYSRYVYVELICSHNNVVTRVKIDQENGVYFGYLPIPSDLPAGYYTIRAYTTFMRSLDENYFFTKTVYIGEINAEIKNELSTQLSDFSENLCVTDLDFDVTFYPEGGYLMQGTACRTAFKAMKSNGQSTIISGVIYDQNGTETGQFESNNMGMGLFLFRSEKGKKYYAVCTNENGQTKRFDLPAAVENGYALAINQVGEQIYVSVMQPVGAGAVGAGLAPAPANMYLIAHTRGEVYFSTLWDNEKNIVVLRSDQFPTGVLHFILFDAELNPVSERLLYINNNDHPNVAYRSDKEKYGVRSSVKNSIKVVDSDGEPLSGSFSVAVTSDREVKPDSTSNILTYFLLTSDLRGHIENPAYYFQNTNASNWALDLLMLTQGWRRYDIAAIAQSRYSHPSWHIEKGAEISGTVKSILLNRPVENIEVNVISYSGFFEKTVTNVEGRFSLLGGDLPDSTTFIVTATPPNRRTRLDLFIDDETFPERRLSIAPSVRKFDKKQFEKYADKADQQYIQEHGERVTHIEELIITAKHTKSNVKQVFMYERTPNTTITEEQLETIGDPDIRNLLRRLPGVSVNNENWDVYIRSMGMMNKAILVLDNMPMDTENLELINVFEIAQVDVVKGYDATIFGSSGGAIVIYTKDPRAKEIPPPTNTKTITPLGYQTPVEFYAPKYDTPTKRNIQKPDLRTTIHWQPVVQVDNDGVASFEFYTADEKTSYTVIIEGLTDNGKVFRQEGGVVVSD